MMNISRDLANKIQYSIQEVIGEEEKNIELEAVYSGGEIKDKQFKYLMKHYLKDDKFSATQSSTLDISQNKLRVTIAGNDQISEFCKSKGKTFPDNIEIIEKSRFQNDLKELNSEIIKKLGFKINMKIETKKPNTETILLPAKTTTFRLKKRYSFQATSFRIDMTIVRQYKSETGEFSEHSLSRATPKNEVEIEFLPQNSKCSDENCSQLTNEFLNLMYTVSCVFGSAVEKASADRTVIEGYKKMLNLKTANKDKIDQHEFLSYKPVTLQVSNLDKKCRGVPGNILENYAVTEKADGDRMLLFIYQSKLYLLNDQRKVVFTGIENDNLGDKSLIDGEFIKNDKNGNTLNLFLGFDIYFDKGHDVRPYPFMLSKENRYIKLKETIKKIKEAVKTSPSQFQFEAKEFVYEKDIFKAVDNAYDFNNYKYKIDGLIFQPTNLGCGNLYVNKNINENVNKYNSHPSLSTTWNRVYKWKPPLENTIDLLIKIPQFPPQYVPDKVQCELRAYNNQKENVELNSIKEILIAGDKYDKFSSKKYVVFAKQDFSRSDLQGVENGDIWEFTYIHSQDSEGEKTWIDQRNNKQKGEWKKHKKREDKTIILRNKNKHRKIDDYDLAGSANAVKTANNVYSTIVQQPIYQDVIEGKNEPNVAMTSQYYVNTLNRKDRLILPMQNFHNLVKDNLIKQFKGKLVDVACGVGGDISKYADKYELVLGFDISFDGIFGYNDSAWVRYLSEQHKRKQNNKSTQPMPPMLFLPQNMGKELAEFDDQNVTEDEKDFQKISEYINGKINENQMKEYKEFDEIVEKLKPFKKAITDQFDVVSCQFALHYFFKDEDTLETFCKNVNILLKEGGHFIGTCFDGSKVNDKFIESKTSRLEGNIDGNVVWRIDRAYEDYGTFGSAIDVFVESIGQSRREYLVDFDKLEKTLERYDIVRQKRYSFETLFTKFKINMRKQDEALQNYSGMNQCFIFQKKINEK